MRVNSPAPPEPLAFAGAGALEASVSHTGSRLAYTQYYGDSDIYSIRGGEMSRSPLSSVRNDNSPQYSPDGSRVVFSSFRSGAQELWVANPDGSGAVQLTTSRASGTPRWSPDGRHIVFDTQLPGGQWRIRVVDRYGGQPVQVVRDEAEDTMPSFSRNGQWIYFASSRAGRQEIHRVPSGGGEAVRITDNGGSVSFESIDGESLYYTKTDGRCVPLFVRSLSGGPERQVVDSVCFRGFVVTAGGIYYVGGASSGREYAVRFFDPGISKSVDVYKIDSRFRLGQGLGISPDGKTILISAANNSGADLMLVEGFR
jgi:Tol biopolymer transport system component